LEWLLGSSDADNRTRPGRPAADQAAAERAAAVAAAFSADPSLARPPTPADPRLAPPPAMLDPRLVRRPVAPDLGRPRTPIDPGPADRPADPNATRPATTDPRSIQSPAADSEATQRPAVDPSMPVSFVAAPVRPAPFDPSMAEPAPAPADKAESDRPVAEPVEVEVEPVEAEVEPVEAVAEPVEAEVEPIAAHAEPIEAAAEPLPDDVQPATPEPAADAEPESARPAIRADLGPVTAPIPRIVIPPHRPEPEEEPADAAPSTAEAPTTKAPTAAPEVAQPSDGKRTNRPVLVGAGVLVLAAAAATGAVVAVQNSGSSSTGRTSGGSAATQANPAASAPSTRPTAPVQPAEPAAVVAARTWLAANIPHGQRLSADANLVAGLRRVGFPAAHAVPGDADADWHQDTLIVSTARTRSRAAAVPALNAELAASIPVAVFGSGTQSVEVRMVFGTSDPDVLSVQAQRQEDVTNRRVAGEGILSNPRVTVAPAWTTLIRTGGLDLRASVMIGLIADRANVGVISVVVDPAENAAGVPARTVQLSMPQSVLPGILAILPPGYRPSRTSSPTQNNTQVTELSWGVTLTPQPTLS
jgi:hypothetical protein